MWVFYFTQVLDSSHALKRWVVEYSGGETSTVCRPEVSASPCVWCTMRGRQHGVFPGGHPCRYKPRPTVHNFGDLVRTTVCHRRSAVDYKYYIICCLSRSARGDRNHLRITAVCTCSPNGCSESRFCFTKQNRRLRMVICIIPLSDNRTKTRSIVTTNLRFKSSVCSVFTQLFSILALPGDAIVCKYMYYIVPSQFKSA